MKIKRTRIAPGEFHVSVRDSHQTVLTWHTKAGVRINNLQRAWAYGPVGEEVHKFIAFNLREVEHLAMKAALDMKEAVDA